MTATLCTARECYWIEDCGRHADNNKPNALQGYRDYSRELVIKDGVRQQRPYFQQRYSGENHGL